MCSPVQDSSGVGVIVSQVARWVRWTNAMQHGGPIQHVRYCLAEVSLCCPEPRIDRWKGVMARARIEMVLALSFGALTLLTAAWPDWIEGLFRVDLDRGNGTTEWAIVGVLGLLALASAVLLGRDVLLRRTAH